MASSSQTLFAPLRTLKHTSPISLPSRSPSLWISETNRSTLSSAQPNHNISAIGATHSPKRFSCLKTKVSTPAHMTTEKKKVHVFDSEEALLVSLEKYTADLSEKFIKLKGSFTVVVFGGSLIKSLK